jgi:hypothetical protein
LSPITAPIGAMWVAAFMAFAATAVDDPIIVTKYRV